MPDPRGARVDSASDKARKGPQYGRDNKPTPRPNLVTRALDAIGESGLQKLVADGGQMDTTLLAAVILAQALDRYGEAMRESAAIGQYRRGP